MTVKELYKVAEYNTVVIAWLENLQTAYCGNGFDTPEHLLDCEIDFIIPSDRYIFNEENQEYEQKIVLGIYLK